MITDFALFDPYVDICKYQTVHSPHLSLSPSHFLLLYSYTLPETGIEFHQVIDIYIYIYSSRDWLVWKLQILRLFQKKLQEIMGSLMAGWGSPNLDDERKVRARRNRSLTKEEIQAFWIKHQRKPEDGEGSPVGSPKMSAFGSLEKRRAPSPLACTKSDPLSQHQLAVRSEPSSPVARIEGFPEDAEEKAKKSSDWWTKSNWAFLNEPPQEEIFGKAQRYTPQFHVARISTGNA